MRITRCALLVLFVSAPTFALAQQDSVIVRVNDLEFPAYTAQFGQPFEQDVGPAPLAAIEPAVGCEEDPENPGVFIPAVDNPEELEGNIALISRGICVFVLKAQAAAQAGAIAYIVYNDDRVPPGDTALVTMGGDCEPDVCSAPGVFVSRASGLALLAEAEFGSEALLDALGDPPPPPPTVGTHDTGVVALDVFDYGFIGTDVDFGGTGFTFGGVNGLFVGSVLVGIGGNVVSNPYDGFSEWTVVSEVEPIAPPLPHPFEGFDSGFETSFESPDLGVRVTERSYSRDGDAYVILELDVENISGAGIQEAYIGLFADFDAGTMWEDDVAAIEEDLNLVYVYDPVEEDTPYFGVMALPIGFRLSGYSADATTADDAQLFEALATEVEIAPDPVNRAAVIGLGPVEIAADASVRNLFALIGGYDEVDLLATASGCFYPPCPLDTEASTPEGTFRLESVFPNPLASQATIGFTLPTAQDVRLAVYDVLGREVAVLADGVRAAGEQAVTFDASALPSGVYLVRLEADGVQLVERVTVVR